MKPKLFSTVLFTIVVLLAFLFVATMLRSQALTPETIACSQCQHVNEWRYKFCVNCGIDLSAAKTAQLQELQRRNEAALAFAQSQARADSIAQVKEAERQRQAAPSASPKLDSIEATSPARAETRRGDSSVPTTRPKQALPQWFKEALHEPVLLPRLFNVPTAGVLGSLDLYFTGGGAFGIEKERNFLGRAGMGLGDIAEVEFATQAVINSLQRGSATVPTSAFKMQVLRERGALPAIAAALRGTTSWQSLQGAHANVSFETRLTKLYLVASKKRNAVSMHVGLGLTDVRVRHPQGWNFKKTNESELQGNLWAPFAGASIQANPKAQVLFEIEGLPAYNFSEGGSHGREAIKNIWAGVIGVRFYFTNWIAADTGVRYRSDFDGIADANIQANLNMLLPLGKIRRAEKVE